MRLPLDIALLKTLQRGAGRLADEARDAVRSYVCGQMEADGSFVNRAGKSDLYYTMFGWMMCHALSIPSDAGKREAYLRQIDPSDLDALHLSVYRQCVLLHDLMKKGLVRAALNHWGDRHQLEEFMAQFAGHTVGRTLNGTAASLFASRQTEEDMQEKVREILALQDQTGGFYANEGAAMPDLLSTAVALFTLRTLQWKPRYDASDFIEAHFQEDGSFMPNLLDEQSDVEYCFYGLLALGAS